VDCGGVVVCCNDISCSTSGFYLRSVCVAGVICIDGTLALIPAGGCCLGCRYSLHRATPSKCDGEFQQSILVFDILTV